jgi:hypothetical protein
MFPSIDMKHFNESLFVWYLISINIPPTKRRILLLMRGREIILPYRYKIPPHPKPHGFCMFRLIITFASDL